MEIVVAMVVIVVVVVVLIVVFGAKQGPPITSFTTGVHAPTR